MTEGKTRFNNSSPLNEKIAPRAIRWIVKGCLLRAKLFVVSSNAIPLPSVTSSPLGFPFRPVRLVRNPSSHAEEYYIVIFIAANGERILPASNGWRAKLTAGRPANTTTIGFLTFHRSAKARLRRLLGWRKRRTLLKSPLRRMLRRYCPTFMGERRWRVFEGIGLS